MKKEKKALSPVVATVLLIVLVVVIALIVFFWIKGMTQEAITKFDNRNIELVCEDVDFDASYTKTTGLYITNFGNVPIYGIDVKIVEEGSHKKTDLTTDPDADWPAGGLIQGGMFVYDDFYAGDTAKEIILVPVLLGESNQGRRTYACNENRYGVRLSAK